MFFPLDVSEPQPPFSSTFKSIYSTKLFVGGVLRRPSETNPSVKLLMELVRAIIFLGYLFTLPFPRNTLISIRRSLRARFTTAAYFGSRVDLAFGWRKPYIHTHAARVIADVPAIIFLWIFHPAMSASYDLFEELLFRRRDAFNAALLSVVLVVTWRREKKRKREPGMTANFLAFGNLSWNFVCVSIRFCVKKNTLTTKGSMGCAICRCCESGCRTDQRTLSVSITDVRMTTVIWSSC